MKLKTLEQNDAERRKFHEEAIAPHGSLIKNGIECPECKEELCDIKGHIFTTDPPKIPVECPTCGWKGARL